MKPVAKCLLFRVSLCALSLLTANAQITWQAHPMSIVGVDDLQIRLRGANIAHYAIGYQAGPLCKKNELKAGEVAVSAADGVAHPTSLQDWPSTSVSIKGSSFTFNEPAGDGHSLVVDICTTVAHSLSIYRGADLVLTATPALSASILVKDGTIMSVPFHGLTTTMYALMNVPVTPSGPIRKSDGVYVVPTSTVAANIQSFSLPSRSFMSQAIREQQPRNASLVVQFGTDGTVMSIVRRSGDSELLLEAENAVRQWTVRPILIDGKPVVVESLLNFALDKDGKVRNPLALPPESGNARP